MSAARRSHVQVYVDPSCPFAWITAQWLAEVESHRRIVLEVRLLSLAVVNEHRDIDEWYRAFNDAAWAPARVMFAVERTSGRDAARRFYEEFGRLFHVERATADEADRIEMAAAALARAGLPNSLIGSADDTALDPLLREITSTALAPVGLDVGVPVTVIDGTPSSGPVLSSIPRGSDADRLFDAVATLAGRRSFVRFERQRHGSLIVT